MGYRENIIENIRNKPNHPYYHGVKMQAHHLISKKALKDSGLKSVLEHLGYDIDKKENLVLLPCTLQGACHLGVQLHRGDHKALAGIMGLRDDRNDRDRDHSKRYHRVAGLFIKKVNRKLKMGKLCKDKPEEIQKALNKESGHILRAIKLFKLPLTAIHTNFKDGGNGCCGVDGVKDAKLIQKHHKKNNLPEPTCPTHRNHLRRQGQKQARENILYVGGHKLKVGQ